MPTTQRSLNRLFIGLLLACGAVQVTSAGQAAAAPPAAPFVKYYTVAASYRGAPENLTEIAVRFLGDGSRAPEILTLNSGREQPDGGTLQNPATLRAGWSLMLPWDAYGDGVRYGLLPETMPTPSPSPTPVQQAQNPPAQQPPKPQQTPSPKPEQPQQPQQPNQDGCDNTPDPGESRSTWAQERLTADRAWPTTRGDGIIVAVVDSGVDATLPELSGRVEPGADITVGSGTGDSDCLGTGTGMAAIIAGTSDRSGTPSGLAPKAVILPIRVTDDRAATEPADQATAIEVAVSAGARVVAFGAHADLADPAVSAAVSDALTHDVLVVVPAYQGPRPEAAADAAGALLAVGAVDADGRLSGDSQGSGPDVVAPGVGVATLGVNGSGTVTTSGPQYAVAFAAGQAALVRAAHPTLTAAQVKHRIEQTADRMGGETRPDTGYGWGMINPSAAVSATVDGEIPPPPADPDPGIGLGTGIAIAVVTLILLAAMTLLVLRARSWAQGDDSKQPHDDAQGPA
ncbi:S8 family serine peptidase [Catenuloplanes japonicus]|uniref:S8 family serine peptidase n=1 Tax=Catenuloplanes japonicus TaxID=33876 RepID=UPI0007C51E43|nr:S8 family serine peptidase [Catenuloplanes japonicus]